MARTAEPTPDDSVRMSEITDARGMQTQDYTAPDLAGFESRLFARLLPMIEAGATDVETIAVLDEQIDRWTTEQHLVLDTQRTRYTHVASNLAIIAAANLKRAENHESAAGEALKKADGQLEKLMKKHAENDPTDNELV